MSTATRTKLATLIRAYNMSAQDAEAFSAFYHAVCNLLSEGE